MKFLRNRCTQQTLLAGLFHKRWHESWLEFFNPLHDREYFCLQKIMAELHDHLLLLIEILRNECVRRLAFADKPLRTPDGSRDLDFC